MTYDVVMEMDMAHLRFYSTQLICLRTANDIEIQMFCYQAHYIPLKPYSASRDLEW